tara:strand:+ start:3471 stop:4028 length:558 start_codon:yes stop_codon:yes gene_type:complete
MNKNQTPNFMYFALKSALLDKNIYRNFIQKEEVSIYSLIIVSISALSVSIGIQYRSRSIDLSEIGIDSYLIMMMAASSIFVGWMLWAYVSKVLCSYWGDGNDDFRKSIRTIGIAYSPGILMVFTGIPIVGPLFMFVASIWILISVTVAISAVNKIGIIKSLIPGILGWIMSWILVPWLIVGQYIF